MTLDVMYKKGIFNTLKIKSDSYFVKKDQEKILAMIRKSIWLRNLESVGRNGTDQEYNEYLKNEPIRKQAKKVFRNAMREKRGQNG